MKKHTYRLTANNANNIKDSYYYIIRDDDNIILLKNKSYEYIFQKFCEIALDKEMKGELHNFIIE